MAVNVVLLRTSHVFPIPIYFLSPEFPELYYYTKLTSSNILLSMTPSQFSTPPHTFFSPSTEDWTQGLMPEHILGKCFTTVLQSQFFNLTFLCAGDQTQGLNWTCYKSTLPLGYTSNTFTVLLLLIVMFQIFYGIQDSVLQEAKALVVQMPSTIIIS